ncbi:hypothetical protein [Desulfosporosinus youngiae]|uniref:Uncharacterized protein n=1 Tax=Desulfosporosinus youngiae DSM 17734 TaxID=768710 RepID=H5Y1R1_9FIRM|nr:hypothetical protein [Desulfosporosinus youngiae]EHQ87814.1 hypothetical protein DesyoDRAFT_0634 [Desulfosporosinus youngiae DSM 17734]
MSHSDKKNASIAIHPGLRHILLANPTQESVSKIIEYQLFEQPNPPLADDILYLLPSWEQQALEGNEALGSLIQYISQHSLFMKNEKIIHSNLLRIRILASTPGIVSFPALEIQEHLVRFLQTSDSLADLPELEVVSFSESEIKPLSFDLTRFRLTPHSRRYIQNLFRPERREAILSVLAYITKNYPLISTCRQAYALMLSLDNPDIWGNHPFCVRLVANRFWDSKLKKTL